MSNFEIFCKLCDDKDYYLRAVEAFGEHDAIRLSQIIGKKGLPINKPSTVEETQEVTNNLS